MPRQHRPLNHLRRTPPGRDALIQEFLTGTNTHGADRHPGLGFTVLPRSRSITGLIQLQNIVRESG
jgi:hypothetical protein